MTILVKLTISLCGKCSRTIISILFKLAITLWLWKSFQKKEKNCLFESGFSNGKPEGIVDRVAAISDRLKWLWPVLKIWKSQWKPWVRQDKQRIIVKWNATQYLFTIIRSQNRNWLHSPSLWLFCQSRASYNCWGMTQTPWTVITKQCQTNLLKPVRISFHSSALLCFKMSLWR